MGVARQPCKITMVQLRYGDHVRDAYAVKIPWYCPRGRYAVWVGLFLGDARMRVTRGAHDGADRVRVTTLDLR